MEWYFRKIERQLKLKAILDSWIGTPFRHRCAVKGPQGGVDCINFVAEIFREMELINRYTVPKYPSDWHLHRSEERLITGVKELTNYRESAKYALESIGFNLESSAEYTLVDVGFDNPLNGDIIMFKYGRVISHAAIYYDDHIYQAMLRMKVESRPWKDRAMLSRRKHGFRIMEMQ